MAGYDWQFENSIAFSAGKGILISIKNEPISTF
jgi:hypothetical protein